MPPFEVEADLKRRGQRGYCSHALDGVGCANGIIKAHTVQRNGGLAAIAEGQSRVITVKPTGLRSLMNHEGSPPPREIGIGQASVFPGFCGRHDTAVFKDIEGADVALTADDALLFAYRAMAYERFAKAVQVAHAPAQRQMDRGQPLAIQQAVQTMCHIREAGAARALAELDAGMAVHRTRLSTGDLTGFHHRAYRFDRLLPIVACGAFMPELSIDGTRLQHLARGTAAFEQLTLTVTSYADKSIALFAWTGPVDGPAGTYADAFDAVPDAEKADVLIQLAFEQLENIFLRISWWRGLPDAQRAMLSRRVMAGIGFEQRTAGPITARPERLAEGNLVERTAS